MHLKLAFIKFLNALDAVAPLTQNLRSAVRSARCDTSYFTTHPMRIIFHTVHNLV